jgi:uncharacterized protein
MGMKLSRVERWILSNQYRILEELYPGERESLEHTRTALERGYEGEYEWSAQHVYDADETMTAAECTQVIDILDMHVALKQGCSALPTDSGVGEWLVEFRGFDGSHETKHMAYALHYCDGAQFSELAKGDFNSHTPSLDRYRAMLDEWKTCPDGHALTKDEIIRITAATGRRSRTPDSAIREREIIRPEMR